MMLFTWIITLLIIYFIWKNIEENRDANKTSETKNLHNKTPLEILKERYAKGEITKEEFEEVKKCVE